MNVLFILCLVFECMLNITVGEIGNTLTDYFISDTFKSFQRKWQIEKRSFENALVLILEQNYGVRGMNIYVRKMPDFYKLSNGFYFSDNVVHVVLLKMYLQELPNLVAADVNFALASNFLRIEAGLGKMIVTADYLLIRNHSEVKFTGPNEESNDQSPFSYQQVQDSGALTIVAEDCTLVGYTITSLSGDSVNLGLDTFKITNCKFRVEIYTEGTGSPPVMAQYFSKSQSVALEKLLTKPIQTELMPKLQASVFTYVNSSAIFGDELSDIRLQQNKIFKETSNYVNKIVKNYVSNTIKDNHGTIQLKPFEISWNKACMDGPCKTIVRLKDMILYGLDTAYSAHNGGLYKPNSVKVAEAIRFSTMQVRGKLYFENTTVKGEHDFAVELRDVEVRMEMDIKSSSFTLVPSAQEVVGWRAMEFSIIELDVFAHERRASESLITGYLINEIPKRLFEQLSQTFAVGKQAYTQDSNKPTNDQSSQGSDSSNDEEKYNKQESKLNDKLTKFNKLEEQPFKLISDDSTDESTSIDSDEFSQFSHKEAISSDSSSMEYKFGVRMGGALTGKDKKIADIVKMNYTHKLQHPSDNEVKK